jgi:hypothetical protein
MTNSSKSLELFNVVIVELHIQTLEGVRMSSVMLPPPPDFFLGAREDLLHSSRFQQRMKLWYVAYAGL